MMLLSKVFESQALGSHIKGMIGSARPLLLICGLAFGSAALAQDGVTNNNVGVDQDVGIDETPAAVEGRTPNDGLSDPDDTDVRDRVERMSESGTTDTPTNSEQLGDDPLVVEDQDRDDGINVHPTQSDSAVGDSEEEPNQRR